MNADQKRMRHDYHAVPRWMHRLYAFLKGYSWAPCPICGKDFGWHERAGELELYYFDIIGVCPNCTEEAERRNRAAQALYKHLRETIGAGSLSLPSSARTPVDRWVDVDDFGSDTEYLREVD